MSTCFISHYREQWHHTSGSSRDPPPVWREHISQLHHWWEQDRDMGGGGSPFRRHTHHYAQLPLSLDHHFLLFVCLSRHSRSPLCNGLHCHLQEEKVSQAILPTHAIESNTIDVYSTVTHVWTSVYLTSVCICRLVRLTSPNLNLVIAFGVILFNCSVFFFAYPSISDSVLEVFCAVSVYMVVLNSASASTYTNAQSL